MLDSMWPLGSLLLAAAAWLRPRRQPARARLDGWRLLVVPAVSAAVVFALLVYDTGAHMGVAARVLTYAALLAIFARAAMTFDENIRLLRASRADALTDALTGLANRRRLMDDLPADLQAAEHGEARLLLMFDLDGFKHYNDTYGHPAGDALLARLGAGLRQSVAGSGRGIPHGRRRVLRHRP